MAGAVSLIAEIDKSKIARCIKEGWVQESFTYIGRALKRTLEARGKKEALAIGIEANVLDVLSFMLNKNIIPDIVTDQTAAHDPLNGYFPKGLTFDEAVAMRKKESEKYVKLCKESMRDHVASLLELKGRGATVFDYGNGIRFHAKDMGLTNAFDIKGFVPLYVRPLFCQGRGPFRVAALSGDAKDIAVVDSIILRLFAKNKLLVNWISKVQKAIDFSKQPGLPAD